jgi:hypothetical protein
MKGQGKPLPNLGTHSGAGGGVLDMAHKMMKNAGVVPGPSFLHFTSFLPSFLHFTSFLPSLPFFTSSEWIVEGKELREEIDRMRQAFKGQTKEVVFSDVVFWVDAMNKKIKRVNLITPVGSQQVVPLNAEDELERM